jgi:hypothetical protein
VLALLPCLLLLLAAPALVRAQDPCAGHTACPALQAVTTQKIAGPIKYKFDTDRLTMLSAADRQDFINRFNAAAAEWSRQTGISISEAGANDTAQVRVRVSNATVYQNVNGRVEPDPNFPGDPIKTLITFSADEYHFWSSEGKDRLMFHEIGHLLGFDEVPEAFAPAWRPSCGRRAATTTPPSDSYATASAPVAPRAIGSRSRRSPTPATRTRLRTRRTSRPTRITKKATAAATRAPATPTATTRAAATPTAVR